jgi:hypothetical protein
MTAISNESIKLINEYIKDNRIKEFYETQLIHTESEVKKGMDTWFKDRMQIEKIFAETLHKFKINIKSYDAWYIMASLIDRSSYFTEK